MALFVIQLALIKCQIFCEYRKFEDWFKIILPDKLYDAFEAWSMMMLLLMAGLLCEKSKGAINQNLKAIKLRTKSDDFCGNPFNS